MPQTGDLDSNTLKMMSASRCGNPDNEVGIPPITTFDTNLNQAAVKTPGKKRSKRSLTMKDIFKRIQEKDLTDISPGMINDTISRRKRWIEVRTTLSSRG